MAGIGAFGTQDQNRESKSAATGIPEVLMFDRAIIGFELQHSNLLLQLWLLHAVVSLLLVFGVAALPGLRRDRAAVGWLLAGYLGYAVTHLMCLQWILKQWGTLAELAKSNLSPLEVEQYAGVGLVEAPNFLWVVPIHLIASGLTALAIWRLSRSSRESFPQFVPQP